MPETKFKFKMGSDPEFSFVLQDKRITASNLLNSNLARKKEFSKKNMGYECAGGEIGWDGCNATAELRPKPSDSITEITSNIKEILTQTHKYLPLFDMSVLSTFAPVGGHIHFEISEEMHNNPKKIAILHKKVSSFFLPIMISENKINLRLRCGGHGYGTLTDFHGENAFQKENKTEYTYEFRTPSAEWLTTEKICNATFAYMGVIYNEITNNPKNFAKYMDIVFKNNEQAEALHKLAITNYIGITEGIFNQIKKAVRTFELYKEYKEQIEYILNPKKVYEDKKKAEYNIIKGWNLDTLCNTKKPSYKDLINEKQFKAIAKKKNLDEMTQLMNISYNDDINVEFFIKTLTERTMAFNWKIKNNYFIFGMKKGINETIIFNEKNQLISGENAIKTEEDNIAMKQLMDRISSKFLKNKMKTINLITGELEKPSTTIIGLPYELRIRKDPKEFIRIIYNLENKLMPVTQEINLKNLINDTGKPEEEKGNLWKYVNNIPIEENEEIKGICIDEGSQGRSIARENIENIINQEIRDERDNTEDIVYTGTLTASAFNIGDTHSTITQADREENN